MTKDREAREGRGDSTRDDLQELKRLRSENAELRMERDDAPMFVKPLRAAGSVRSGVR